MSMGIESWKDAGVVRSLGRIRFHGENDFRGLPVTNHTRKFDTGERRKLWFSVRLILPLR